MEVVPDNVIKSLIHHMVYIGQFNEMKGKEKKEYVMKKLREEMRLEPIIEDLIIGVIDLLIKVEDGELIFNPKIKKGLDKCCFPFYR